MGQDKRAPTPKQKPAVCSFSPVSHTTNRPTNHWLITLTLSHIHQKTDPRFHVLKDAERDAKMLISLNRFEKGMIIVLRILRVHCLTASIDWDWTDYVGHNTDCCWKYRYVLWGLEVTWWKTSDALKKPLVPKAKTLPVSFNSCLEKVVQPQPMRPFVDLSTFVHPPGTDIQKCERVTVAVVQSFPPFLWMSKHLIRESRVTASSSNSLLP